jgi:hypothetical protein
MMRRTLGVVATLTALGAVSIRAVPRIVRLRRNLRTLAGVHVGSAINPAAHAPD